MKKKTKKKKRKVSKLDKRYKDIPYGEISPVDINQCKNALRACIRQQFARSGYYKQFIEKHAQINSVEFIDSNFNVKHKKVKQWQCNVCSKWVKRAEFSVDHVNPIGKGVLNDIKDIYAFYELVYCSYDNLQIICKKCHDEKTKREQKAPSFDNAQF